MEPDTRDAVAGFVEGWSRKTGLSAKRLIDWIGIREGRFYQWVKRIGQANQHNGKIPRAHQLLDQERQCILDYQKDHRDEGYRRLTYMMMDEGVVAVSPATVYRILAAEDRLSKWDKKISKKGTGFVQPTRPHEHWHIDISYINILGTFYYMCSVLDGFSRYIVHWEIRESMTEDEVEIIIQRGTENAGRNPERLISDNGPQFIARDFKEFLRMKGMKHVRTSPYYPQSNGKIERYQKTAKEDLRKTVVLSLEDAIECVSRFVVDYNETRLHSALGYVTPKDMLEGRAERVYEDRERKLEAARAKRRISRRPEADRRDEEWSSSLLVSTAQTVTGTKNRVEEPGGVGCDNGRAGPPKGGVGSPLSCPQARMDA